MVVLLAPPMVHVHLVVRLHSGPTIKVAGRARPAHMRPMVPHPSVSERQAERRLHVRANERSGRAARGKPVQK